MAHSFLAEIWEAAHKVRILGAPKPGCERFGMLAPSFALQKYGATRSMTRVALSTFMSTIFKASDDSLNRPEICKVSVAFLSIDVFQNPAIHFCRPT